MRALARTLTALLTLLAASSAWAQAPAEPPAAPAAPEWLILPAAMPDGWAVRHAGSESATVAGQHAKVDIALQTGTVAEIGMALTAQLQAEFGGAPQAHWASLGGGWVAGKLWEGTVDGEASRALFLIRKLPDGRLVTATIRGRKGGPGFGVGVELMADTRVKGDSAPKPLAPMDLSDRPEARINPVGLYVPMPKGWKPKLQKKANYFTLKAKTGVFRFEPAGAATQRDLKTAEAVKKTHGDAVVQPLFWPTPGRYRAWQVIELDGDTVESVKELHLVRFKKLDDWKYKLVTIDEVDPATGFAQARSVLAKVKLIP